MLNHYLEQAGALASAGQPFVIATVVRAETPTSAKAGAKAIVTADGQLDGWVGGSCAQPTVIRESLRALADGQPRFLRLCPPERVRAHQPGVVEVALACISGGTLEIYIEPHLPQPHLLIIGHLPVVEALTALAKDMNYRVTVAGENASLAHFGRADRVLHFDQHHWREQMQFDSQTYVVVASHGNYDEPALEAALSTEAAYVALVASRKRREAVVNYLRDSGLSEEQLGRLKSPAGLDIGAVTPEEIALSIMAEIVQCRRAVPEAAAATSHAPNLAPDVAQPAADLPSSVVEMRAHREGEAGPGEAVDPVCFMIVEVATARYTSDYGGRRYYFCAPGCKRTFDNNPMQFAPAAMPRP